LAAGYQAYVLKPVDPYELVEMMATALDRSRTA
jgi:hypothetical protein